MHFYSFVVFVKGHEEIELREQGVLLDHGNHAFNALIEDESEFTAMLEARGVTVIQRNCLDEREPFDCLAFTNEQPLGILVGSSVLAHDAPEGHVPDPEALSSGPLGGDLLGDPAQPPADAGDAERPDRSGGRSGAE